MESENKKMAGISTQQYQKLKEQVDNVTGVLFDIGITPGDEIWVIRSACYECSEHDDHCGIGCKNKDKKYLEKIVIASISINIQIGNNVVVYFKGNDGETYKDADLGKTVFTNREDALNLL